MEKYSVLMSLYQKEKPDYLMTALDSMIYQSVAPDEIVLVKDGPLTPELEGVLNEYVNKYAEEYGVEKNLVYALIKAESNFNPKAISHQNANGLMQLMYPTAEELANKCQIKLTKENILDPDININLGTQYIAILLDKYECVELALAAYNAGSGNVDKWIKKGIIKSDGSNIENIPYKETNMYVRKIMRDYEIYIELES